jgi:hypothetical protein
MLALSRLSAARLTRTPRAWLTIAAWSGLAIAAAAAKRIDDAPHGADLVMLGAFGSVALPLLAYAIVGAALGGDSLPRSGRSLTALGASPASVALASLFVAVVATSLVCVLLGAGLAALAHSSDDPPIARDVVTCAWVSGLGGASYAALFGMGAAIGPRGAGRGALLAADWIVGSGTSAGSVLLPRAHLRSLFGGEPPLTMSQRASALALVLLAIAFVALATFLARRSRG